MSARFWESSPCLDGVSGFRINPSISFIEPTSLKGHISLFLQPLHVFYAFPQGFIACNQPLRRLTTYLKNLDEKIAELK